MDANNPTDIRFVVTLAAVLLCGVIWSWIIALRRRNGQKGLVYLTFFTVFYVYIVKVLDYTLFQFQSLLLLRLFTSHLILNGQATGASMNLIPLVALTGEDVRTSLLNVLLLVPFGFGLPFITNCRMRKTILFGALFSIGIELSQLITGLMANMTFRIADINDVIFNTAGVTLGCTLFIGFVHMFPNVSRNFAVSAGPSSNPTARS